MTDLAPRRNPLPAHPAKFSDPILHRLEMILRAEERRLGRPPLVLDPFAGVGRVHKIAPGGASVGVEIQPRWADCHDRTVCGDAYALPFAPGTFDAVVTSPCYANRMADHHDARDGSTRRTYRHVYGAELHPNNTGTLQWGPEYRRAHARIWPGVVDALAPGGLFVLNVSDHYRGRRIRHVTAFHMLVLGRCGLLWVDDWPVDTDRMRHGENAELRAPHETIIALRKPGGPPPKPTGTDDDRVVVAVTGEGRTRMCAEHLTDLPCGCGVT